MDMAKIVYLSSSSNPGRSFQLKRHRRVERSDHITKLPDELLCSIISRLTLIEAVRTSVLARRWKVLWYHFHGALEFDETKRFMDLKDNTDIEAKTQAVHDRVSSNRRVLESLQSPFFDAFKVRCYNMDGVCKSYLDFCVQFVMKKKMKVFELDAFPNFSYVGKNAHYYFPVEFYDWLKKPCGLGDISSLTNVSVNCVMVSDAFTHLLLLNFPLLESLRVTGSFELYKPKFIGETLKLKYLEIWGRHIESIKICAPNLSTLLLKSKKVKLIIKNAPKLVELSIPVPILKESPESVSSYLPHLERLTWDFSFRNNEFDIDSMHRFVAQNKLQHLTWKLGHYYDRYSIQLNSLLEASPFLHKFTLVIFFNPLKTHEMVPTITAKHPHQCLKVLEIDGFTGAEAEVKLVKYFVENTTSLEEIILNITGPLKRANPSKGEPDPLKPSKLRAFELKEWLPTRVSLVILE